MTNTKTKKPNTKSNPVSSSKAKLVAGAIGVAVIAGGAGYAYNELASPLGSIYTVSNYQLRKVKRTLGNLEVRANDVAPTEYNSNGYVPTKWARTSTSSCEVRYDILVEST